MSQQEFVPRSQSDGQDALNDEDEIYQPQYPYHWSGKLNKEGAPRDEPPSSYAEPTIQRGYQAQDYASSAKQQGSATSSASQQWSGGRGQGAGQQFSPDGDAFEQGYRPYNTYNVGQGGQGGQRGVPPWARPQTHKRGSLGWLFIIIFLFFMIRPIFSLFGFLGGFIGVAVLAIVLPIILVLVMMTIFGFILRSAFWPGRYRRGPGRYWYRRGPFWW